MATIAERVPRIIREYDVQGWHRTGTEVDHRSAEWLAGWVRELGLEPVLEPFALARVEPLDCAVAVEGRRVEGLPLFDGGFTDATGITGHLSPAGGDGVIGLFTAPPQEEGANELEELRRASRHRALVLITRGGAPGLAARNAPRFTEPFGLPVVQVSSECGAWLQDAAARGAVARLTARVERLPAEAVNVTAMLPGTVRNLPPLVVMTPRSGWWHCASERGGGIACWFEAMAAGCAARPRRDVLFLATSGHELGHLGLEAFLAARPALPRTACAWVHFGANIGAAGGALRLAASDEQLERMALAALAAVGAPTPPAARRRRGIPAGEARNIYARGGRYLSFVGSNPLFHLESDRWPTAVDEQHVLQYAMAAARLVVDLATAIEPVVGTGAAARPVHD